MTDKKVAIVMGASSGIGKATALELASHGYVVYLAARRAERLTEVARLCADRGAQARVVPTDVTIEEQVQELVKKAVDEFGRVDVMVNNAGYGIHARMHETTDDQMRRILDVNYFGVFYGCRAAAPVMIRQGSGHIFNVSSVIGKRGTPFNGAYCATKFAVCGLTDCLRVELREHGVWVTCVCPGLTESEFFDKVEGGSAHKSTVYKSLRTLQPAEHVARKIVASIGRDKPELVFTAGGKFLVLVAALWPRLTDRMMKAYYRSLARQMD